MTEGMTGGFEKLFVEIWRRTGEPLRPSTWLMDFFGRWSSEALGEDGKEMLILGSTPELRDLALSRGIKPVCCDLSEPVWREMTTLMSEAGDEEFLHCNWLEIPTERKFTFIAGEAPTAFLEPGQIEPFVARMADVLADDGIMAIRAAARSLSRPMDAFGEAVESFRRGDGVESLHMGTVLLITTLMSEHFHSVGKPVVVLDELRPYLSDDEFEEMKKHYGHGQKFYAPKKEELEDILAKYFRVLEVEKQEGAAYWDCMWTYALGRR